MSASFGKYIVADAKTCLQWFFNTFLHVFSKKKKKEKGNWLYPPVPYNGCSMVDLQFS